MQQEIIQRALNRIDELGRISDHTEFRLRTLLSPANRRAAATILDWMSQAGMETEHSIDGSVRGILGGSDPDAPPLLLGSHFDTVIDAGAYDGPLGIISALAAIEQLRHEGLNPPFPIHLLAFSDEEGTRFKTTYIGSMSMVSELGPDRLLAEDHQGRSLSHVLATEGWHQDSTPIRYKKCEARSYIELHIEQGRVLEDLNLPASAVTSLVGQTRLSVTITGQADHAGTTPMRLRRDALAGAAECITKLEAAANSMTHEPGVATVGQIAIHPGAANAIPQVATFSVDLRHPDNDRRLLLRDELLRAFQDVCDRRNLEFVWKLILDHNATPCDAALTETLLDAVEEVTGNRVSLVSGAGHDGVALAPFMPIGMILVRCRDGISHHPDEFTSAEDVTTGIEILTHYLRQQITQESRGHA